MTVPSCWPSLGWWREGARGDEHGGSVVCWPRERIDGTFLLAIPGLKARRAKRGAAGFSVLRDWARSVGRVVLVIVWCVNRGGTRTSVRLRARRGRHYGMQGTHEGRPSSPLVFIWAEGANMTAPSLLCSGWRRKGVRVRGV